MIKNPEARKSLRKHASCVIGEKVKELRLAEGWTQKECAEMFQNCDESYFRSIENGCKDISLVRAIELADFFKISVSELLEGI